MPLPSPATPRQRGVTLISLMIGLVISMILVLATLMLFQRMVRATTAARSDAQADTQRSAAFLAAGIAAQEAGYGINAAQAGTHLMVLTGAELAGSALSGTPAALDATGIAVTGNAVVWAENTTGTTRCSALLAPNGSGQGGLRKLGPVDCGDATTFSGLAWTALPLSDTPATPVVIAWQAAACTPFGISAGTAAKKVLLTLSAHNSNGVALETSQCLSNVSAP